MTWTTFRLYLANAGKALIQITGMLSALLSLALLPEPYAGYVATAVSVLTIITHYKIPNATAPGHAHAIETESSNARHASG